MNCAYIYRDAAAETGPSAPWGRLLRCRQTWAFAIAKFFTDPIWYFYLFWLPSYFSAKFNLDLSHLGLPLIVVYNVSAIGSIGGGWLPASLPSIGAISELRAVCGYAVLRNSGCSYLRRLQA
jgi:ACS family hexuronate transporter-like MFS transporter